MGSKFVSVSAPITGTDKTLTFETGKLAQQSQGAVVASIGETKVLCTANASKSAREGQDFFPLTVNVEERAYAAGKIPGSFFRREGRPSDAAILTCRLIDRPLRPTFPEGFRNEVDVVATILGNDQENPHDVLAINAASAALRISGIPFAHSIGAVRLGFTQEGTWIPHVTYEDGDECTFEIVVAGRVVGDDVAIMMVEAGGTEKAWDYFQAGAPKVTEERIAEGLEQAKTWIRESCLLQEELVKQVGDVEQLAYTVGVDYEQDVYERVAAISNDDIAKACTVTLKQERNEALDAIAATAQETLAEEFPERGKEIKAAVRALTKKAVRARIVNDGVRMDGRAPADLRAVSAEVGLIDTAHGTGLFQRGETQVLNVLTLGMPRMDQLLDTIDAAGNKKRYMHHYNMPPFANGETGRMGSPKRREIGHGLLAERALLPVVPHVEEFPYALRLVSEVLASNGSTSMGSVCASTLSLMDGGVPIKAPVAGIAMGLVYAEGKYTSLTDILGAEDAFGDMDFKVAGTADFVTALQLDTKIDGLPADVLEKALLQARDARLKILDVMLASIAEPREEVAASAPKIVSFEIPMDKIGEVIGPKGKVINLIQQETGADIGVDDDGMVGTVTIGSTDGEAVAEARRRIELILDPPRANVGEVYKGRVVNITKFGAFVNILPGRDGLLHISKLGQGKRIDKVEDVVDLGDEVEVRVDDIDQQGKVSLSIAGDAPAQKANDRDSADAPGAVAAVETGAVATASFEEFLDAEIGDSLGDLGPVEESRPSRDDGDRGPVVTRAAAAVVNDTLLQTTRLTSGLTVVTERVPGARSVAYGTWVGVGSRDEDARLAGASHFLEHLLFKGTTTRTTEAIAEAIDAMGGDMNAFTSREHTGFHVKCLDEDGSEALAILTDIMCAPLIAPDDVEVERGLYIVEEILERDDEPADWVHDLVLDTSFAGHPLGRDVLGSRESIEAMPRDDIATFFAANYVPGNVVLAAAGAIDHDAVCAAGETIGAARAHDGPGPVRQRPERTTGAVAVDRQDTEQVHLCVAMPTVVQDHDDRYALAVIDQLLGGGLSSRLFQEVREKRGLAYTIYTYRSLFSDAGVFVICAGTAPSKVCDTLGVIGDELARVSNDGVNAKELDIAKRHLVGAFHLGLEDTAARMASLASSQLTLGHVDDVDTTAARIRDVSRDDVERVVRDLISAPRVVAIVGPVSEAKISDRVAAW